MSHTHTHITWRALFTSQQHTDVLNTKHYHKSVGFCLLHYIFTSRKKCIYISNYDYIFSYSLFQLLTFTDQYWSHFFKTFHTVCIINQTVHFQTVNLPNSSFHFQNLLKLPKHSIHISLFEHNTGNISYSARTHNHSQHTDLKILTTQSISINDKLICLKFKWFFT